MKTETYYEVQYQSGALAYTFKEEELEDAKRMLAGSDKYKRLVKFTETREILEVKP